MVEPVNPAASLTLDELQDHCRTHVAGYKLPRRLVIVEVVQRGAAGKPDYVWAKEHALRHLKASLPPGCASGYSSSRTCEIGLSEQAGFPYQSILYLVERCATVRPASAARAGSGGGACETRASATSSAISRDAVAPDGSSAPSPSPTITAQ